MSRRTAAVFAAVLSIVTASAGADGLARHPGAEEFANEMASRHGLSRDSVAEMLAGAERRQDILDAISRPAEAKPWYQYRPIFLTPERIGGGLEFWDRHEELLERATERYGVEPAVIVAIIGVETRYGQITGRYRVLDALATLAFHYPPRADFFRRELEHFLLLAEEESLDLTGVTGSYAGAMGFGQFIPSSYRAYAVDLSANGRRDLWSPEDAIGSVANYLHEHGWRRGEPVVVRAEAAPNARPMPNAGLKPELSLAELSRHGFLPEEDVDAGHKATLIELEQPSGSEYWIGFHNFYVITRYNRSALYAMAVHQLSRAIADARDHQLATGGQ